jgi:hypothetical protein
MVLFLEIVFKLVLVPKRISIANHAAEHFFSPQPTPTCHCPPHPLSTPLSSFSNTMPPCFVNPSSFSPSNPLLSTLAPSSQSNPIGKYGSLVYFMFF